MQLSFPLIIFSKQEVAYLEGESDLNDFLYSLSKEQRNELLLLNKAGRYVDLYNNDVTPITSTELAKRVTQQLAQEGSCCLSKVTQLTPEQAFMMLDN